MTCIVAVKQKDGRIFMGADSAGVAGLRLSIRADQKVFKKGSMIFGFTWSFRMGQLLQYNLKIPDHPKGMETYMYMVTVFIDEVRRCFKDGGMATKTNDAEAGGVFLVGYRGRIFDIQSDYQVAERCDDFDACGCGADIALGSLISTEEFDAKMRVGIALEAAERFSSGVRRPFRIKSIKP